jgi:hypothetical protein
MQQSTALPPLPTTNYSQYIPLWNPAVKNKGCTVDHDLIMGRVFAAATVAFASMFTAFALEKHFPEVVVVTIVVGAFSIVPFLIFAENIRASSLARANSVNEYLKQNELPCSAASSYIGDSASAAQMLVNKKGDVNKINANGGSLLEYIRDFSVFKILIDAGFDINKRDRYNRPLLLQIVSRKDLRYLHYLVQNLKIQPSDYTADEQVSFWGNLNSKEAATLLKIAGFDINIRNKAGFTPLLDLVTYNKYVSSFQETLDQTEHLSILLDLGADPMAKVDTNSGTKSAWDLATSEAIKRVLENHPATQKATPEENKK